MLSDQELKDLQSQMTSKKIDLSNAKDKVIKGENIFSKIGKGLIKTGEFYGETIPKVFKKAGEVAGSAITSATVKPLYEGIQGLRGKSQEEIKSVSEPATKETAQFTGGLTEQIPATFGEVLATGGLSKVMELPKILKPISSFVNVTSKASSPVLAVSGIKNAVEGTKEGDTMKVLSGLGETAMGTIGAISTIKDVGGKINSVIDARKSTLLNQAPDKLQVLLKIKDKTGKFSNDAKTVMSFIDDESAKNMSTLDDFKNFVSTNSKDISKSVNTIADIAAPNTYVRGNTIGNAIRKTVSEFPKTVKRNNSSLVSELLDLADYYDGEVFNARQALDEITSNNSGLGKFYSKAAAEKSEVFANNISSRVDVSINEALKDSLYKKLDDITDGQFSTLRKLQSSFINVDKNISPKIIAKNELQRKTRQVATGDILSRVSNAGKNLKEIDISKPFKTISSLKETVAEFAPKQTSQLDDEIYSIMKSLRKQEVSAKPDITISMPKQENLALPVKGSSTQETIITPYNEITPQSVAGKNYQLQQQFKTKSGQNILPVGQNSSQGQTIITPSPTTYEKPAQKIGSADTSKLVKAPNTSELINEAKKYKTTINIQNKDDIAYLKRILSEDNVNDILNGKMTNFKGKNYEDIARVNIVSETPKTIEQQLSGKIKDIKLKSDIFYHGTTSENADSIMRYGFKKGSDLPENTFRGGGYGKIQNSISFAETPKEASIFSTLTKNGKIIEAKLKPNSRVVSIDGIEDAIDLEDYIKYLKKEKIDAVYIGGGEKELVVINPKAIEPIKYFIL